VPACIVTNRIIVAVYRRRIKCPVLPFRNARTPPESKPILDNVDKMLGFVPNLHRLMSISPNALSGWATLMGSLAKTLDVKTRDGIALAVSEADGCDYCLAAHSFIAGNWPKSRRTKSS
jgi:alkylhydroperoxidase AhpD family core domain